MDKRLGFSSKQSLFLNLVFKSLTQDPSLPRTRSFIRRIIQVCVISQVPFVCASLFMIGKIIEARPGLKTMINYIADDECEQFLDAPEETSDEVEESAANTSENTQKMNSSESKYDPRKRDPLFANADSSYLWELIPFVNHFHPTVSLYARSLLSNAKIDMPSNSSNYDPLKNHTLSKFIERFVYKNPKKIDSEYKGSSLMQPRMQVEKEQPMNALDWSKIDESDVRAEEVPFYCNLI